MRPKRQTRKVSLELESMEERAVTSSLSLAQFHQGMAFHATVAARRTAASRPFGPAIAVGTNSRVSSSRTAAATVTSGGVGTRAATPLAPTPSPTNVTTPSGDIGDVKNGPLAKAGQDLIHLYQDFQQFGGTGTFHSAHAPNIQVVGSSVRVDVRGSGNVNNLAAALSNLGMQVKATDARTHTFEGLLPISKLPDAAQLSQVTTISPVYVMKLR